MNFLAPLVLAAAVLAESNCGCKKNKALKPALHLAEKIINIPEGIKFGEWKKCPPGQDAISLDHQDAYTVKDVFVAQWEDTVSVHVFGEVTRQIDREAGATLISALNMGKWPISVNKLDFCEFLDNQPIAPKCPLKKGELNMTLQLKVPNRMPPSDYKLQTLVEDAQGERVICLEGEFTVPGFAK